MDALSSERLVRLDRDCRSLVSPCVAWRQFALQFTALTGQDREMGSDNVNVRNDETDETDRSFPLPLRNGLSAKWSG
jgi:hypothetical protein